MRAQTVSILGADYKVKFTTEKKEPKLQNKYGYCNQFEKEVLIETEYNDGDKIHPSHTNMIIRHELIHAFISESGFKIEHDEDLVNWIAQMFPKMMEAFKQLEVTQ